MHESQVLLEKRRSRGKASWRLRGEIDEEEREEKLMRRTPGGERRGASLYTHSDEFSQRQATANTLHYARPLDYARAFGGRCFRRDPLLADSGAPEAGLV